MEADEVIPRKRSHCENKTVDGTFREDGRLIKDRVQTEAGLWQHPTLYTAVLNTPGLEEHNQVDKDRPTVSLRPVQEDQKHLEQQGSRHWRKSGSH